VKLSPDGFAPARITPYGFGVAGIECRVFSQSMNQRAVPSHTGIAPEEDA
jgi:hypothetical protein